MQVKGGVSRIVLLLPSLGLAIKFPRIKIFSIFKFLWLFRDSRGMYKGFFSGATDQPMSLRWRLFNGISQNLSEYHFYQKTKNIFAWPTYFSLWGLFNVQPLGQPSKLDIRRVRKVVWGTLGEDRWDPHTFEKLENFCRDQDGRLYLLDYGSKESQFVLVKYGEELQKQLGADY